VILFFLFIEELSCGLFERSYLTLFNNQLFVILDL